MEKRALAVDMQYVGAGIPGDGVEASVYTQYPEIETVVFNFSERKQIDFKAMGQDDPWAVYFKNGDPSAIEFAIPSPKPIEQKDFMGGTVINDEWSAPLETPDIVKSLKLRTAVHEGKYVEYTIPKASISARLSQAPSGEQTDLMLVKAVILSPVSSGGVKGTSFKRAVKTAVVNPAPAE